MIDIKKMCGIRFLKKKPFTGSYEGMRYRLIKNESEEGLVTLYASVWPGPFAYAATDDSLMTSNSFEFNNEGFQSCVNWLNEVYNNKKWKK